MMRLINYHLELALVGQNSLDQTTFDMVDYDPLISGIMENTSYFNIDVGMSYVNSKYYAHLTVKNLLFAPDGGMVRQMI